MTKEEAVNKAIEIEFGLGNDRSIREHNSSLVKIAEHVYDLLHPSLPSNLDEAAEEYVSTLCDRADEGLRIDTTLESSFKAGAEWMAGQGEIHDCRVLLNGVSQYKIIQQVVESFEPDEIVTVQIRKKYN